MSGVKTGRCPLREEGAHFSLEFGGEEKKKMARDKGSIKRAWSRSRGGGSFVLEQEKKRKEGSELPLVLRIWGGKELFLSVVSGERRKRRASGAISMQVKRRRLDSFVEK